MQRDEAVAKLRQAVGEDLRVLASRLNVTVFHENGKLNKGWAGHTLERYLGLPLSSAQSPDGGDWELKVVSLRQVRGGLWQAKETMAITMINPEQVAATPFEESHLYRKLQRLVVCGRGFVDRMESSAPLIAVETFDFDDYEDLALIDQIRQDYEHVRRVIVNQGFSFLTGKMGILVQPRTKGPGHGSISRAFYGRTTFVNRLLKLGAA